MTPAGTECVPDVSRDSAILFPDSELSASVGNGYSIVIVVDFRTWTVTVRVFGVSEISCFVIFSDTSLVGRTTGYEERDVVFPSEHSEHAIVTVLVAIIVDGSGESGVLTT